jgi:hypothetical protein
MSMDLAVWSPHPFKLPRGLPDGPGRDQDGDEWAFEGPGWHVLVVCGATEDESDVPEPVRARLPLARFAAYVTLEPIGAGPEGYRLLENVVRSLAREYDGVWSDGWAYAYRHDEGPF